jgi:hypothetical protein
LIATLPVKPGHAGHLALFTVVSAEDQQPPGTRATAIYKLLWDRNQIAITSIELTGGQSELVPMQALVRTSGSQEPVEVRATASYSSRAAGEIIATRSSLIGLLTP